MIAAFDLMAFVRQHWLLIGIVTVVAFLVLRRMAATKSPPAGQSAPTASAIIATEGVEFVKLPAGPGLTSTGLLRQAAEALKAEQLAEEAAAKARADAEASLKQSHQDAESARKAREAERAALLKEMGGA